MIHFVLTQFHEIRFTAILYHKLSNRDITRNLDALKRVFFWKIIIFYYEHNCIDFKLLCFKSPLLFDFYTESMLIECFPVELYSVAN